MNNDYVEIEQNMCPVCGVTHTHNTGILIDKHLKPIKNSLTGYGLCEEHDKLFNEGYVALVVANSAKHSETINMEDAIRTGDIMHMKREVFSDIFNSKIKDDQQMVFIDPEAYELIKSRIEA